MDWFSLDRKIESWLTEDIPHGDITSDVLFPKEQMAKGIFIAKEDGCIAGLAIAERVFKIISSDIEMEFKVNDGDTVTKGTIIAEVKGNVRDLLKGERLALNLLQRMSGIATMTRQYADKLEDYETRIVDTRKTTPGLRTLEKYAVTVGGGYNHRFNLSESVMLKDNHIKAAGDITAAIKKVRDSVSHVTKIEVEVEDLMQFQEAVAAGADIILLDNMDTATMAEAVKMKKGNVVLEASGNITLERLEEIAKAGVDVISSGSLTHSVKALDISMRLID